MPDFLENIIVFPTEKCQKVKYDKVESKRRHCVLSQIINEDAAYNFQGDSLAVVSIPYILKSPAKKIRTAVIKFYIKLR